MKTNGFTVQYFHEFFRFNKIWLQDCWHWLQFAMSIIITWTKNGKPCWQIKIGEKCIHRVSHILCAVEHGFLIISTDRISGNTRSNRYMRCNFADSLLFWCGWKTICLNWKWLPFGKLFGLRFIVAIRAIGKFKIIGFSHVEFFDSHQQIWHIIN